MMPGMNGFDLARAIRVKAPNTEVVLMTAHGSEELRNTSEMLHLSAFVDKPFSIQKIRTIVQEIVERTQGEDPYRSGERELPNNVRNQLQTLQVDTGARCVLLLSSGGYPIDVVGMASGLDITSLSALIARISWPQLS